ncbi:MAG: type IV pilus twitching motility protein PilT [Francisellaceae bacterium]|nr:type IV pilus twitching motility protein PilT [Francisellaceae bacterium]MBT6538697.1 type IV pilus twitching motility protein PilT [Francisellaceae bacterium]
MDITELLAFGVKNGASDVHITTGMPPLLRVDGTIKKLDLPVLTNEQASQMLFDVMSDEQRKDFQNDLEIDFSFEIPDLARFRVNVFHQDRGVAGVLRTIPTIIKSLEELGAPTIFKDIADTPRGLVLVTGPTGSGKSTTLAAMVNYLNENKGHHILTVEDPIEFVHKPKKSVINQREVRRDTKSFNNALRSALREDPDVILVGEMRDLETIRLALSAAETGHVVFGTLHTSSAPKTIDRMVDVFPAGEKAIVRGMLSESLRAVISQVLVPKEDVGRAAAHEIMIASSAIRNLIREEKVSQMYSVMQTGKSLGMQTLDQCLQELVRKKTISMKAARMKAENKDLFK